MPKISTRGRYALRIMRELALFETGPVSLREVASRVNLGIKYLESIASLLLRAGLLTSLRGKDGGYMLSRPAAEYTLYEILSVAEGDMTPVNCMAQPDNDCPLRENCPTLPVWEGLNRVIREYLSSVRLSDLLPAVFRPGSNN